MPIDWFNNYFYSYFSVLFIHWFFFSLFLSICSTPAKLNGHAQLDVPGLSQNEIQGLLLGSHQSQQAINVKREPEDLRIDPKCPRSQKVSKKMSFFLCFFSLSLRLLHSLPLPCLRVKRKLLYACTMICIRYVEKSAQREIFSIATKL